MTPLSIDSCLDFSPHSANVCAIPKALLNRFFFFIFFLKVVNHVKNITSVFSCSLNISVGVELWIEKFFNFALSSSNIFLLNLWSKIRKTEQNYGNNFTIFISLLRDRHACLIFLFEFWSQFVCTQKEYVEYGYRYIPVNHVHYKQKYSKPSMFWLHNFYIIYKSTNVK